MRKTRLTFELSRGERNSLWGKGSIGRKNWTDTKNFFVARMPQCCFLGYLLFRSDVSDLNCDDF